MTIRPTTHLLLPLLALSLTLGTATARAQDRQYQASGGTSATLHINFGTTRHWTGIQGTHVEEMPAAERPDYDMFRYSGNYYVYNNNRWYTSGRENGDFTVMDDRSVPSEFSMIPRDHWRNYPSGWQNRQYQGTDGPSASLQVNFGSSPRWTNVRGTRVRVIRRADRQDYDMFRYGRNYYVYNNNRWYTSRQWHGEFTAMDDRSVPNELSRVPRQHWRNYPSDWLDENGNPRYGRDGQRR